MFSTSIKASVIPFEQLTLLYFFLTYYALFLNMASVNIPEHILSFIIFIIYSYPFYLMPVIIFSGNAIYTETVDILDFDQFRTKFIYRTCHVTI